MDIDRRVGDQLNHLGIDGMLIHTDIGYGIRVETGDNDSIVEKFSDISNTDSVMREVVKRLFKYKVS